MRYGPLSAAAGPGRPPVDAGWDATADGLRVSFREVLAQSEFRAVWMAQLLSLLGDQLARVSLTVLVYQRTGSATLAGLAFALTYLPQVAGGPLLASLADRFPRKGLMVASDVARAAVVLVMCLPGLSAGLLLGLLTIVTLAGAPGDAARSAMLPDLLPGARYVVGLALGRITSQASQVLGFGLGGLLLTVLPPRLGLAIDSGTFCLSALLIATGVRARPGALAGAAVTLRLLAAGASAVVADARLRAIVLLVWGVSLATIVPEGLAAPYAARLGAGTVGMGLLLAANPVGMMVGFVVVSRVLTPVWQQRLTRPLAGVALLPLAFCLAHPPLPVVLVLLVVSGLGMSFNLPANAAFVQWCPPQVRGRAFGVVSAGLSASQGIGILLAGALAGHMNPADVVGGAGALGVLTLVAFAVTRRHRAGDRREQFGHFNTEQPFVEQGPVH